MIIVRAPFRVSFVGGGSDLPSFYEKYGGCVISTTIRKYMYLALHPAFDENKIVLKYSKTESVSRYEDINHKIFKIALEDFRVKGVEITSMADIPSGTGLGSSSAFTVALLKLLSTYKREYRSNYWIAREACDLEIKKLGSPIGKQDQFASTFGGLNFYEFMPSGFVRVEPIIMKESSYSKLQNNLLLFYTGVSRDANVILKEQSNNVLTQEAKIDTTKKMCDLTRKLKERLEVNDIDSLGKILNLAWQYKKELASGISNPQIDDLYNKALAAGALGGKLLGAGGGGFLLFYVNKRKQKAVKKALENLKEVKFELDNSGVSVIHME